MRDQTLFPSETTGKITVLYILIFIKLQKKRNEKYEFEIISYRVIDLQNIHLCASQDL